MVDMAEFSGSFLLEEYMSCGMSDGFKGFFTGGKYSDLTRAHPKR